MADLTRRHALSLAALALGAGLGGAWGSTCLTDLSTAAFCASTIRYLTARKRDGRFEAVVLDAAGRDVQVLALPARGHSFAIDLRSARAVVFARQAGFFALAFDIMGKHAPQVFAPVPARHFYGHGVYLDEGRVLVATENDYATGRGVLGLYDATPAGRYRRIAEYDSAGIGPHEVIVLPDARTLCVANGGILTHPDYGKQALNLADMVSSLVYLDAHTGALLEQQYLPAGLQRLSIRHLTLDAGGHVWFACQYAGSASDSPPLLGRHRRSQALELFYAPTEIQRGLKNYMGSVSTDASGLVIATSSPVGGIIAYWDARSGRSLGSTTLFDGCGVAPASRHGFLLTSGQGSLVHAEPGSPPRMLYEASAGLAWDNHCRALVLSA